MEQFSLDEFQIKLDIFNWKKFSILVTAFGQALIFEDLGANSLVKSSYIYEADKRFIFGLLNLLDSQQVRILKIPHMDHYMFYIDDKSIMKIMIIE